VAHALVRAVSALLPTQASFARQGRSAIGLQDAILPHSFIALARARPGPA